MSKELLLHPWKNKTIRTGFGSSLGFQKAPSFKWRMKILYGLLYGLNWGVKPVPFLSINGKTLVFLCFILVFIKEE